MEPNLFGFFDQVLTFDSQRTHTHMPKKNENELGQRIDSGAKLVHNSKWVVHLVFFHSVFGILHVNIH